MHESRSFSAQISVNGVDIFYERAGTARRGVLGMP